jgi:hypothetical protein
MTRFTASRWRQFAVEFVKAFLLPIPTKPVVVQERCRKVFYAGLEMYGEFVR